MRSRRVASSPSTTGHLDVHEHDVGIEPVDELDRLLAVRSLPADGDSGLALEDRAEARTHERLVVGDDDRDLAVGVGRLSVCAGMGGRYSAVARRRIIPGWDTHLAPGDDDRGSPWSYRSARGPPPA